MGKPEASPTANSGAGGDRFSQAGRPSVMGPAGVVSTGHYLATAAGLIMLAKGGNAVDAGVAAGLCLNVVHNDMNTLSGVAPIVLYDANARRTTTFAGVGRWPAAASAARFREQYRGIPDSLARCVVPAAAASWLNALHRYGTMSFEEVSEPARRYARDGFPVHSFMHHAIGKYIDTYKSNPENERIFLIDGAPPPVGTMIMQPDLFATLTGLVKAEQAASNDGREVGIEAVIDYFYRGPVAASMVEFSQRNGGLLVETDMTEFSMHEEDAVWGHFGEWSIAACGPWSQGPALPIALNILNHFDLHGMGHNSAQYINTAISAIDLAFADRNAYCGDPEFVDVPLDGLLDARYGWLRASLIKESEAFREPVYPGDPVNMRAVSPDKVVRQEYFGEQPPRTPADTSCVTVVDSHGNMFAATPSDGYCNGPIIPGLGLHISERGSQSFLHDDDPNVVAPGKRPRLTPNPVLIFRNGTPYAAMATPGNDRQIQAMLQVFLNMAVFNMTPQEAVEAPRFASYNFRASTWPGNTEPGRVCLESGIADDVAKQLAAWGRDVRRWPHWCWSAGGVSLSLRDGNGLFLGAADPRREGYAVAY